MKSSCPILILLVLVLMCAACTSSGVQGEGVTPAPIAPEVSSAGDGTAASSVSPAATVDNPIAAYNTEDYKLLAKDGIVFNDGCDVRYEYSILDLNNDLKKGKESFNNLLSNIDMGKFVALSADGKKILQENSGLYEIVDINGKQIFEIDLDYTKNFIKFSPNLNYCFLFDDNGDNGIIINTQDNTTCKAQLEFQRSFIFSDDGLYYGCIHYVKSSGDNSVDIYDSKNGQLIYKISIEGNESTTYINQIHNSKRVLYTYESDSYMINFDGNSKTLLGHNIFFTQLSEDEKYLAYTKTYIVDLYVDIDESDINTLGPLENRGLYIMNMITGDTKFFPYPDTENEVLRPVQWLSLQEG